MPKKIYYSAMKNDKLVMPWQTDDKNILNVLKRNKDVVLVKLRGDAKYSLDDLVDVGELYIYDQQSLDDFMNEKTCGSIYLDNAFTLIDRLDMKYPQLNDTNLIYLATALAQKLNLSQKLSWMLMTSFITVKNHNLFDIIEDFYQDNWDDFDKRFFNKLIEEPYQPPNFSDSEIIVQFVKYKDYQLVAKALQDLFELSKIDKTDFSLLELQLNQSQELVKMALEMKKFFK
ncbi:hypothetical protein [Companilactobacillus kedongensis]|uniref:hypothetical protein n=1 Tax=Companilactobacillus kedongensis TaxID=2486004 RepID=UPI000F7A975B|nr:hypothetical protein [Companilactobacillus kedongensis]